MSKRAGSPSIGSAASQSGAAAGYPARQQQVASRLHLDHTRATVWNSNDMLESILGMISMNDRDNLTLLRVNKSFNAATTATRIRPRVAVFAESLGAVKKEVFASIASHGKSVLPDFDAEEMKRVMPKTHFDDSAFFSDPDVIKARRVAWNNYLTRNGISAEHVEAKQALFCQLLMHLDWMGGDESFKTGEMVSGYPVTLKTSTVLEAFIQIELKGRYEFVNTRQLFAIVAAFVYGPHAITALAWVDQMFHRELTQEEEDNGDGDTWLNTQGGYRWSEDWDEGDQDLGTRTGDKGNAGTQMLMAMAMCDRPLPWTLAYFNSALQIVGHDNISRKFFNIHAILNDAWHVVVRKPIMNAHRAAAEAAIAAAAARALVAEKNEAVERARVQFVLMEAAVAASR